MPANQPGYHGVKSNKFPWVRKYAGSAKCEPVSPPVMSVDEKIKFGCNSHTTTKTMPSRIDRSITRMGVQ
jgi:hypothetical protein